MGPAMQIDLLLVQEASATGRACRVARRSAMLHASMRSFQVSRESKRKHAADSTLPQIDRPFRSTFPSHFLLSAFGNACMYGVVVKLRTQSRRATQKTMTRACMCRLRMHICK